MTISPKKLSAAEDAEALLNLYLELRVLGVLSGGELPGKLSTSVGRSMPR
jgi:hypothetical protein